MLERAASVFPDHVAVIHGKQRFTYAEFYRRSRSLASALAAHGKAGLWNVASTMSVAGSGIPPGAIARARQMGAKVPGEQSYVVQSCVTQAQVDAGGL